MNQVWAFVAALIKCNAKHRSGFRMGETPAADTLARAQNELDELKQWPDDPEEMADVMAILIHYCIQKGWTLDQLCSLMMKKMKERFDLSDMPVGNSVGAASAGAINFAIQADAAARQGFCGEPIVVLDSISQPPPGDGWFAKQEAPKLTVDEVQEALARGYPMKEDQIHIPALAYILSDPPPRPVVGWGNSWGEGNHAQMPIPGMQVKSGIITIEEDAKLRAQGE